MKKSKRFSAGIRLVLLIAVIVACCSLRCIAQPAHPYNRFQYHKYDRKVLHAGAVHLYFPAGYDSLASFASLQLPDIIDEVYRQMGTYVRSSPSLIICPSPDQLYESNIGLYDIDVQTFPTVNLRGSRVLVPFEGSFEVFRSRLKEAWVRLTWEEQFRRDAEEQLLNRQQLMPEWFRRGSIAFFAAGWQPQDETALYPLLADSTVRSWDDLASRSPVLSGQAFCNFLARRYREDAAAQVFFQLRSGKSLPRSVRLVTKVRLDTLTARCFRFYQDRSVVWRPDQQEEMQVLLQQRFGTGLRSWSLSPDGSRVCFVLQKDGERRACTMSATALREPGSGAKPFLVYELPPWLEQGGADIYPLAGWHRDGAGLYVLLPEKGHLVLKLYDGRGRYLDRYILYGVDGVQAVLPYDRDRWLLSAYRKGRSDLVLFDSRQLNYTALTGGIADHTDPVRLGNRLIYRSGYPADSLWHSDTAARPYGLYFKDLVQPLKQLQATPDRLLAADSAWIVRKATGTNASGDLVFTDTRSGLNLRDSAAPSTTAIGNLAPAVKTPWLRDHLAFLRKKDSIDAVLAKVRAGDTRSVLAGILTPGEGLPPGARQDSVRHAMAYKSKKVRPYMLQLYNAYFSALVNNDYYINRYQPYAAYLGTFKFPEAGAMAQGGFSDLFDNHHAGIGYRLPAGTEGSDFFVRYENTARKLDWHLLFFRKVESLKPDPGREWKDARGYPYPQAAKVKTHYYELGFRYPLRYDWTLDFTTAARRDRTVFLATDRYSLTYEALQSWWSISSLVVRADKLKQTIPFLYRGWEGRAMADLMAATGKQSTVLYGLQLMLAWHQPLVKDISFVLKGQAGYSGGRSRILYNFGGLDNNLVPRTDTSVTFVQEAPYAFQTLITPLRGYAQNSLYGGSFGLINADVYFPLFRSLIPLHTGFSALNNLQLGLFADVAATAHTEVLAAVPSRVYAYGVSARSMLAGYPLRFDLAWPGNFNDRPVWYLSLTLK